MTDKNRNVAKSRSGKFVASKFINAADKYPTIYHNIEYSGGKQTAKTKASFGYMCPRCLRIFDASVKVSAELSLKFKQYDSTPAYEQPKVIINPATAVIAKCPFCTGMDMIPVDPGLAYYRKIFIEEYQFTGIRLSPPISENGISFNHEWIEFRGSMTGAKMKRLLEAILYVNKTGVEYFNAGDNIKTYLVNDVISSGPKMLQFTTEIIGEVKDLLDRLPSDTYIRIEDITENDVIPYRARHFFYSYLDKVTKKYYQILEEDRKDPTKEY